MEIALSIFALFGGLSLCFYGIGGVSPFSNMIVIHKHYHYDDKKNKFIKEKGQHYNKDNDFR